TIPYSADAASADLPVNLAINGTNVGTQKLVGLSSQQLSFNVSAFLGQQINSVVLTFDGTANPSADFSMSDITATFCTPDANIQISPLAATNAVGTAHTLTVAVQQDDCLPAGAPGDAVTGFGPAPNGSVVHLTITSGAATFVATGTPSQD